jgi:hypothetical protein
MWAFSNAFCERTVSKFKYLAARITNRNEVMELRDFYFFCSETVIIPSPFENAEY